MGDDVDAIGADANVITFRVTQPTRVGIDAHADRVFPAAARAAHPYTERIAHQRNEIIGRELRQFATRAVQVNRPP